MLVTKIHYQRLVFSSLGGTFFPLLIWRSPGPESSNPEDLLVRMVLPGNESLDVGFFTGSSWIFRGDRLN